MWTTSTVVRRVLRNWIRAHDPDGDDERARRRHDQTHGRVRTVWQRRADALVEMGRRSATLADADPGRRPRVGLTVIVGVNTAEQLCETLAGSATGAAPTPRCVTTPPSGATAITSSNMPEVTRPAWTTGGSTAAATTATPPSATANPTGGASVDHPAAGSPTPTPNVHAATPPPTPATTTATTQATTSNPATSDARGHRAGRQPTVKRTRW